jgi:hypothetical protein
MTGPAVILSAIVFGLAVLHLLWAIGFWFPIRDEGRLVAAVIGTRNATRMPGPIPCVLVATGLVFAAAWPWVMQGALRQIGLVLLATIFLIRGILPWRPGWRRMTTQEPFATYDRRYYGPLSLGLGAGFAILLVEGI